MSAQKITRYSFGWSDPIAIVSGQTSPAVSTHKRRVMNEEGEMDIFENDYVHGAVNDNQQSRPTERTTAGT